MNSRALRAWILLAGLLASAAAMAAHAESAPIAGVLHARAADPQPRVRAEDLARVLGAALSTSEEVLVLRRDGRAMTLFAGSAEAVLAGATATEEGLSAPVLLDEEGWWLPLDAGAPLGLLRLDEGHVRGPDGRVWSLRVEAAPVLATSPRADVVQVAPGARGLQMYAPGPDGGEDVVALWVSELSQASLVVPGARAVVDAALAEAGSVRALLVIGTSLVPGAALAAPAVYGDSRRLLAPNERLETLSGTPERVGPEESWIAVVWLPPGVSLDRPLRIVWSGAEAEIVFRDPYPARVD